MTKSIPAAQMETAKKVKGLRQSSGMSLSGLAKIINVSRPTMYIVEDGSRRIYADELQIIANTFHVSIEWLLGEDLNLAQPKIEILMAHELGKLTPGVLNRVLKLVPSIRAERRLDLGSTGKPIASYSVLKTLYRCTKELEKAEPSS